jgi:hypothetical protein
VLEHWESERDCVVKSLLEAKSLELPHSSVGGSRAARERIVQEEGLD